MDCFQARFLGLLSRRDGNELALAERQAFVRHLQSCPECQTWDRNDRAFETQVTAVLNETPMPVQLESQILRKLAERARPRPWLWGAAAALFLFFSGIGGLVYWWAAPGKIDLSPNRLAELHAKVGDRQGAQSWLLSQGYKAMPSDLRSEFLVNYELIDFQNRRVPRLTYLYNGERQVLAYVYVFKDSQCRIASDLEESLLSHGGGQSASLSRQPGYLFLTISLGGSLEPLRNNNIQ